MKENPDILFKSKNYEETFTDLCEEIDKPLYLQLFNDWKFRQDLVSFC